MSAWQCSTCHVTVLAVGIVRAESFSRDAPLGWDDITRVFRRLARENARSLRYRYPNDGCTELRAACAACAARELPALHLVTLARCYAYQACEHPGWLKSQARRDIERMVYELARDWPNWDSGPWGIPNCS